LWGWCGQVVRSREGKWRNLQTLISLQGVDPDRALEARRRAAPEGRSQHIPRRGRGSPEAGREGQDPPRRRRKDSAQGEDLEVVQASAPRTRRGSTRSKTNKEYSAVLIEIEEISRRRPGWRKRSGPDGRQGSAWTGESAMAEAASSSARARGGAGATLQGPARGNEADLAGVRTEQQELAPSSPRTSWPTTTGSRATLRTALVREPSPILRRRSHDDHAPAPAGAPRAVLA